MYQSAFSIHIGYTVSMDLKNKLREEFKKITATDVFLIILGVILIVTLLLCIGQYRTLARNGHVQPPFIHHRVLKHPITVVDIQPWMTFGYLNAVFRLPPKLLQEQLGITSSQYPRLSLQNFSSQTHQNPAAVVTRVQSIISSYQE